MTDTTNPVRTAGIIGAATVAAGLVVAGLVSGGSTDARLDAGAATGSADYAPLSDSDRAALHKLAAHLAAEASQPRTAHRPHADATSWLTRHPGAAAHLVAGLPVLGVATPDPTADPASYATTYDGAALYSDLLSPAVAPGGETDVGVTLGSGQVPLGVIVRDASAEHDGDPEWAALGYFDLTASTSGPTDDGTGTWWTVHVKNTDANAAHRFVADFAYGSGA